MIQSAIISTTAFLLPLLTVPGNFVAGPQYMPGSMGIDVGYPNCRAVVPEAQFGVVGVTGGRAYTVNQCLRKQAMTFPNPSLYINTGWNGKSDVVTSRYPHKCSTNDNYCLAYNFGYNAGTNAYETADRSWIRSGIWWLDVETANTWSDDTRQNRNSLQGEHDALADQGVAVIGAYSTSYQWDKITGGWKNGWPSWGATVVTTPTDAGNFCTAHEFAGGPTLLVQYRPVGSKIDHDIAC